MRFPLTCSLRKIHYGFNQCCELNLSACSLQSSRKRVYTAPVQRAQGILFYVAEVRLGPHTSPFETRAPFPPSGTQEMMPCHARRDFGYTLPRQTGIAWSQERMV